MKRAGQADTGFPLDGYGEVGHLQAIGTHATRVVARQHRRCVCGALGVELDSPDSRGFSHGPGEVCLELTGLWDCFDGAHVFVLRRQTHATIEACLPGRGDDPGARPFCMLLRLRLAPFHHQSRCCWG